MGKLCFVWLAAAVWCGSLQAQNNQNYSAVNPVLFSYKLSDVRIVPPVKHNGGKNIIVPTPSQYPWEKNLGNGMPNVIVDGNGNLSLYVSCFLIPSPVPFSKVGVMAYTNSSSDPTVWTRPDAGLYWYNPKDSIADTKLSPVFNPGYQATNVVAVDIESLGIYEDADEGIEKPMKLVYLPQREKFNRLVAGYEMKKEFDGKGILSGFSQMKRDRMSRQIEYNFRFINADTHMGYLKFDGDYYLYSRINAKRSTLYPGESLPFPAADPRDRYRRETVTRLGSALHSGNYDFDVALDRSTQQWEPYSLQPFQFPDFKDDVWWGIVTMFGSTADTDVNSRQRTELAVSNNGVDWHYLAPGIPFLDNGSDPESDDYGCINMGKPILAGRYSSALTDLLYYYVASRQRHVGGRVAGVSLAKGKYGKWAGLSAGHVEGVFRSSVPPMVTSASALPKMSLYEALRHDAVYAPAILADITEDPRGKPMASLESYVSASIYAYDKARPNGKGMIIAGNLGSSQKGTATISDNYESVGEVSGIDLHSKDYIFQYMKHLANGEPKKIVSLKDDCNSVPVVFEAIVKNATFYGIQQKSGVGAEANILDTKEANRYKGVRKWSYEPESPTSPCHTESFAEAVVTPDFCIPTNAKKGTVEVVCTPQNTAGHYQTVFRMYGDDDNNIALYFLPSGEFLYRVMVYGEEFASIRVAPPAGVSFAGHQVMLSLEALKAGERKYGKETNEDATVLRVSCPDLEFEKVEQQDILWNWKHEQPTEADNANARAFAYAQFSAFVAGMKKITVGASDENCNQRFLGSIHSVSVAESLVPNK